MNTCSSALLKSAKKNFLNLYFNEATISFYTKQSMKENSPNAC